jgi:hypothetical protein
MKVKLHPHLLIAFGVLLVLAVFPLAVSASHSWGNYHWARTSNPFNLKLGDNVSSAWDSILSTTSSDWTQSTVLNTTIVAGGTRPRNCRPTNGRVEVCNNTYGNNGWLGIAQIWASGSHITQGTVRVNDTYFNTPTYNTTAWRNLVMCQEVGHTFGLDHQDENFNNANLGTCMDYTNNPGTNQHPNQHDYQQLETIYAHLDSTTTVGSMPAEMAQGDFSTVREWGKLLRSAGDGRPALYERDFGGGHKVFTFVIWAR